MAFSSIPFIFIFLPIFILIYYLLPKKWWRDIILFLGSVFFFIWLDPSNLPLLLVSTLFNYFFGILIGVFVKPGKKRIWATMLTAVGVAGNLLVLGFYKYAGFFSSTLQSILRVEMPTPQITLPIGISFFTFTGIAYLMDVFHAMVPAEKNPLRFVNFMIMFPKVLLGPIAHFDQVKNLLGNKWFDNPLFSEGLRRFSMGLGKKVILADSLSIVTARVFTADFSMMGIGTAWFGLLCYSLQIFFDFAGYTDMALGLGLMLGYHLPENFNLPYVARSLTEFWRRWHITLTGWFRSYVFFPLNFRWRRAGLIGQISTLMIVFLLTGLWHGAGWNFVLWGGYFGLLLALESLGWGKILAKLPPILQTVYTFFLVCLGWVFFHLTNISLWGGFFKALFGLNEGNALITLRSLNILLFTPLLLIGFFFSSTLGVRFEVFISSKGFTGKAIVVAFYIAISVLSIGMILANGYESFLYAQF